MLPFKITLTRCLKHTGTLQQVKLQVERDLMGRCLEMAGTEVQVLTLEG